MLSLQNKRILLGITGGIAAYKCPDLVRRLRENGAEVKVIMTRGACEFITPLTLQAVSSNRVHTELLDADAEAAMGHIELARWADAIVVAPATSDVLARFAQGRADDLLSTMLRASDAPVLIAPAMNQAMWRDAATQDNYQLLAKRAIQFIGPDSGTQACGDIGAGRMSEPLQIATATAALFLTGSLAGKHVVITAGPTREMLDPVRYLSNFSSGKMGYALADAAVDAGAKVTLISGPVSLCAPDRVTKIDVVSAQDMYQASLDACKDADLFIASAAVADYRSKHVHDQKLKKQAQTADELTITLVKNPDVLASISTMPKAPFTVGFAAETENLLTYAKAKLQRKNIDLIIANDVSRSDIGFGANSNEVIVLDKNSQTEFKRCDKNQLARQLIDFISTKLAEKKE